MALAPCGWARGGAVETIDASEAPHTAHRLSALRETTADPLVLPKSGPAAVLLASLKAADPGSGDQFGWAVAASGETLVIGAPQHQGGGAAYVFVFSGGAWSQQAKLLASNRDPGDRFGYAVAIDGDTLVVGAIGEDSDAAGPDGNPSNNAASDSGAAYVFTRTHGSWTERAYLKASNGSANDLFGAAVAISGNTIVIGAEGEDGAADSLLDSGAAYVFVGTDDNWSQQAYLKAANADALDAFGFAVTISGDTLAVGAIGEDSNATGIGGDASNNLASSAGAVYVFQREAGVWTQQAYLKASNSGQLDQFGWAVALSGDILLVGAPGESSGATGVNSQPGGDDSTQSGAAYLFQRSNGAWTQQAYLKASNTEAFDQFGYSVAVDGDLALVGAIGESSAASGVGGDQGDNSALLAGASYVFGRTAGQWSQRAYLKAPAPMDFDQFGNALAVSGTLAVVGAYQGDAAVDGLLPGKSGPFLPDSGAAHVFDLSGSANARTDLQVSKDDGLARALPGQTLSYAITVGNAGPLPVSGARLTDTLPASLGAAQWACVQAASNTGCPPPPFDAGSGDLFAEIDLPVGGVLRYTLSAQVLAPAGMLIANTATVEPPNGIEEVDPSDNDATDTTLIVSTGLFADGFETMRPDSPSISAFDP